jgi:restriction system protein
MIPDFQTIMLPLLEQLSDGREHKLRDIINALSDNFSLTKEERIQLLPSGNQAIIDNRIGWARTYLKKANLIENPRRGIIYISESGKKVLNNKPSKIDLSFLKNLPEFKEWQESYQNTNVTEREQTEVSNSKATPDEIMDNAYQEIRRNLAQDLLTKIKECTPAFFEQLVVKLLVSMGYGGSLKDAGEATRLTNDEGIDGIIKEDKLGLDVIYIQAKRWDTQNVGRPDIQSFVGALDGQRANKGVFITTSRFAENAKNYVKTITKKVILIDGEQLASYMIDYGLGVTTVNTYEIKILNNDYFGE